MSFDAIAPHYRWLERVTAGSLLQRCRTQFIHEIKGAQSVLLLGEGRGRFLTELVRINPDAQITCVDASARMLELTRVELLKRGFPHRPRPSSSCSSSAVRFEDEHEGRGRISGFTHPPANRVRFVQANILSDSWDKGRDRYDAVASHFFLDCFRPDQIEDICSMVAARTVSGAPWLLSDFCVPGKGWRRMRARWILWMLYRIFRVMTRLPATRLTPPDRCLQSSGFGLRERRYFSHALLHSDLWAKE
jgi:hypothetical protein